MNKSPTPNKLRWFVQWNKEYRGWEVMLGGFRDSWYTRKGLAIDRRDELNDLEDNDELPTGNNCRKSREW
jgi:hypothetical protein